MLRLSLQHRITYWFRMCTPKETEQMEEYGDICIMEAIQAATGVDFDNEETARERLRIPARMKGGGIRRATETRYPTFLGALLDVLPRCIDRTEANGEKIQGYYAQHLIEVIGEGAYDSEGHMNAQFLNATNVGPYPDECTRAWKAARDEALHNLGLRDDPDQEGWEKMGPLADPTPANAKNRGAADMRRRCGDEHMGVDEGINEAHVPPVARTERSREEAVIMESSDMDEIREAIAKVIQEMEVNTRQRDQHGEGGNIRGEAARGRAEASTGETMEHKKQ